MRSKNSKFLNITIIDDDVLFLELSKQLIKLKHNSRVVCYSTAEEYLNEINQEVPDIIFLDYNLDYNNIGNLNGLDALFLIKKYNPYQPVVMMSGTENSYALNYSLKNGASGFIFKNMCSPNALSYCIENYFNNNF